MFQEYLFLHINPRYFEKSTPHKWQPPPMVVRGLTMTTPAGLSWNDAIAAVHSPGQMFELVDAEVRGVKMAVFNSVWILITLLP